MATVGIDVGSVTVKVAVLNDIGELVSWELTETGPKPRYTVQITLQAALEKAGVNLNAPIVIYATGYGRNLCNMASQRMTEITSLAKGVNMLCSECRTVIDIGGQDTKVIHIDENGKVKNFEMNDKCAAGTGRFLEVMAQALDISIENMGPKSLESHNRVTISSLCTVFAESEVVSLIAEDKKVEDILYGIHDAIAARVITLVARLGVEETVALTGGVALNKGVVHCLKERIKVPIWTHDKPQIIGAIGAAALALEKSQQR